MVTFRGTWVKTPNKVQPGFLAAQAYGDAFQASYVRKHKEGNC